MKANELMIGDWVWLNGNPSRVACILNGQHVNLGDPIPLTEEILEKNGFVLNEEDDWFEYDNHHFIVVQFCRDYDTDEIINESFSLFNGCDCQYVHQLQHALRLCGLNDLADNFKIE